MLDGLVERGYTAIRLDVFPNLVAADAQGRVTDEYCFPKSDWKPAMWGNNLSMTANPRQALKEFIPRCVDRGLLLGLSTWFFGPGCEKIQGLDEFVRVWDETLTFLKDNDLLHNIYYVDLLNEYPLFNGFSWLRDQMETMKRDAANRQAERPRIRRRTSARSMNGRPRPAITTTRFRATSTSASPTTPLTGSGSNGPNWIFCFASPTTDRRTGERWTTHAARPWTSTTGS